MNKIIIPVLASILILGTLGLSQDVFAPDEEPEKLSLGGNGYNDETGNFEIEMSAQFGMIRALQNADFSIFVELTIASPDLPGGSLGLTHDFLGEEIFPDEFGRIKVQFHWDRSVPGSSSLFEGNADVTTEAQILNPAGKPVAVAEPLTVEDLEITPPPPRVEICDNDLDDDGDSLVDCFDRDCAEDPVCRL